MNLFKSCLDTWDQRQTLNHVAVHIPTLQAVAEFRGRHAGTDVQATTQYFSNPKSDARIVVFGHTHESKIQAAQNHAGLKSIYVNSGTWIDSNGNADHDELRGDHAAGRRTPTPRPR